MGQLVCAELTLSRENLVLLQNQKWANQLAHHRRRINAFSIRSS